MCQAQSILSWTYHTAPDEESLCHNVSCTLILHSCEGKHGGSPSQVKCHKMYTQAISRCKDHQFCTGKIQDFCCNQDTTDLKNCQEALPALINNSGVQHDAEHKPASPWLPRHSSCLLCIQPAMNPGSSVGTGREPLVEQALRLLSCHSGCCVSA